jgi:LPS export ABC transporter protein LptC
MRWQRVIRSVIAIAAVAFAIVVVRAFRRPAPPVPIPVAARTEPGAVVEATGGRVQRFKSSREDVRVEYERQLTYANGATKLLGVTITTDERGGGRSFTVKSKEGQVGENTAVMTLTGDVRLASSDGVALRTENATYSDKDSIVNAPGPVEFSRSRMTGSGTGMTYDIAGDVLVILKQAVVHVAADETGADASDIASQRAELARREKIMQFTDDVRIVRAGQDVQADQVTAHLTDDEKYIEAMELRGHSRIAMAKPVPGGLQSLSARDMDLKYGPDGKTLEHAMLLGDAVIFLAGDQGAAGRQIVAKTIDIALAPDGTTPVSLLAREAVQLLLPAEGTLPTRTIRSAAMRADGQADRGLTNAQFTGGAEYRERGADLNRVATAATLDVALKPGMSGFDDARFAHGVHFTDGGMTAVSAAARYDLNRGTLQLTGSEPGALRPHVVNEQIAVDANQVDITLAGPLLKADGAVKSILQPAKQGGRGSGSGSDAKLPGLFKQDKPVNVTADALDYDGSMNRAAYTGSAQLWQEETSVKGATILLDDKSGDLTATSAGGGLVATVTMLQEADKDKKMQRVKSISTSKDFHYEDNLHRATYTGSAHMTSPSGDLTATKIELYLKPSGDELERTEGYDEVTLRGQNRTVTGTRLTYTTVDERYVVTGSPVKLVDECRRPTVGRSMTYLKNSDITTVDGNDQIRTQTTGGSTCP